MEKSTLLLAYIVRTAKAAAIPNENFAGDEFSNNRKAHNVVLAGLC